jgi:hypothetical protein
MKRKLMREISEVIIIISIPLKRETSSEAPKERFESTNVIFLGIHHKRILLEHIDYYISVDRTDCK